MRQPKNAPADSSKDASRRQRWGLDVRHLAIFGIAYFVAYKYGMTLSSNSGAPFWFPDPVLLAALLLSRPGIWWAFVAISLPLRFLVAATPGLPMWFLLAAFANDSLKGILAASLTRRGMRGQRIRFDVLHDLWIYLIAAVVVAPALSGVAGAAAWHALGRAFWPTWRQWFLGDAVANLVCTPLLLYLGRDWRRLATAAPARYAEGLLLFSALPFAAYVAYKQGMGNAGLIDPLGYIPLPFLVWAAVRFGPAGASAALSVMSILSVAAAHANQPGLLQHGVLDLTLSIQLFMVVLAIPILSLAVLVEQQRKTEDSLRESEERFRNMADSAPVMIWISGPDGGATFFNRVWLDFTGRNVEQELGYGWTAGVEPQQLGETLERYSAARKGHRYCRMDYRLRRSDGEYRWILSSFAPRFAPDGAFAGHITSCIDITDLKHAQEESLARQKLESLGVVTAGIAHDFNNLLGSILLVAELAELDLVEGSSPLEEVQKIKGVAVRASEIVRELMIYSGQDKAILEPVDVSQLIAGTLELLKVSISKHAVLQTDLQKNLPAVRGSAPQMRQIVMNLVINASEALGEKDGVIGLKTSRVTRGPDSDPHSPGSLSEGDYLRLEVSDTGCGMTEAEQSKIFDPFYSTKFAGRGMGLAVVQGIVRDHGGSIHLASEPGRGTTFAIFLPCAAETTEGADCALPRAAGEEPKPNAGTILIVEDEAVLRNAISRGLQIRGYSVIEAGDGTAAIHLIDAHRDEIDMILLDATVPGVSSREVFERARHMRPDLKVILTSAYSRKTVEASFAGQRVEHFIRKPFRLDDLVNQLQNS